MSARFFGYNFPFFKGRSALGQTSNVLPRQEDYRLVINDLIALLMTIKGERWFRPSLGAGIPTFLFDPNDSESFRAIENAIRDSVSKYEPRVTLSSVQLSESDDSHTVKVQLFGRTVFDSTNKDKLLAQFIIPTSDTV